MRGAVSLTDLVIERLRQTPLTDQSGDWVVGGEPMDSGDECWFVAHPNLERAPRVVRIEEVACYSARPEVRGPDAVSGRATVRAAPTVTAGGGGGRLVLSDVSTTMASPPA